MENAFSRTELLFGSEAVRRLGTSRVIVFGAGGVGGYVIEALARAGVGGLDVVDPDIVTPSNLNRQILALHSTLGQYKADVARQRVLDINPSAEANAYKLFYRPEEAWQFDFASYDYIVDAVDTVSAKISLAVQARDADVPIISAMGAGNKLDPTAFRAVDIYDTAMCPLARVMRRELRKRGISALKVIYSPEKPIRPRQTEETGEQSSRKSTPGSVSFVPAAAGLLLAGEVVKDLLTGLEAHP